MNALIIALTIVQGFGNGNYINLDTGEIYHPVGRNYINLDNGTMIFQAPASGDRRPAYFDAEGNYYHPTGEHNYINLKSGEYIIGVPQQ